MRRQLVPGLVVRLAVIKAKNRPGIEASYHSVVILEVHCKLRGESMFDNCYESLSAIERAKA